MSVIIDGDYAHTKPRPMSMRAYFEAIKDQHLQPDSVLGEKRYMAEVDVEQYLPQLLDDIEIPLHYFVALPYFYFTNTGYVGSNIQVALGGFVLPAPAAISLLGLGGLATLRRRRSR